MNSLNSRRFSSGIPYTKDSARGPRNACGQSSARSILAAEQVRRDLLAGVNQALDGADRLVEGLTVLAGQFDLDDALDTLSADHDGHADIHVLHIVFAVQVGGAGEHALLVLQIAL